jgi:hypothetical protein
MDRLLAFVDEPPITPSRWNSSVMTPMKRWAYARQARRMSAVDMSRFFRPSSRSTFSSMGRP